MKKGDIVTIYEDPVSRLRPEGKARLVKAIFDTDPDAMERWTVEFLDQPGETFERWVS